MAPPQTTQQLIKTMPGVGGSAGVGGSDPMIAIQGLGLGQAAILPQFGGNFQQQQQQQQYYGSTPNAISGALYSESFSSGEVCSWCRECLLFTWCVHS